MIRPPGGDWAKGSYVSSAAVSWGGDTGMVGAISGLLPNLIPILLPVLLSALLPTTGRAALPTLFLLF